MKILSDENDQYSQYVFETKIVGVHPRKRSRDQSTETKDFMAVVCLDDDCTAENPICKRWGLRLTACILHWLNGKVFWLTETIFSEIDGGCIVFTDDDWETEFHWENILEDETHDGMATFLDDWAVAGPLATMNFMASMYSGQRINLRKLYDAYIPGQERFWDFSVINMLNLHFELLKLIIFVSWWDSKVSKSYERTSIGKIIW